MRTAAQYRRHYDRLNRAHDRRQTLLGVAAVAAAMASGFCMGFLAPLPTAPIAIELVVTDAAGEEWIAGSGDTCADAWTHAAVPADWREIDCRPVSLSDIAAR